MISEFAREHPTFALIAVVLLTVLLWIAVIILPDGAIWRASDSPRIVAATILAAGTITGALLTTFSQRWCERKKKREERKKVATALLVELYQLCDSVVICGSIANAAQLDTFECWHEYTFAGLEPAEARIFNAIQDRLGLLPPRAMSALVRSHSSLDRAKKLITRQRDFALRTRDQISVPIPLKDLLIGAWRDTALAGYAAISSLRDIGDPEKRGDEAHHVALLPSELKDIGEGKSPGLKASASK